MKTLQAVLLLVLCATANLLNAQPPPPPEPEEKIDAMKIAFITKRLELTTEQAQTFWPVYNKYEEEKKAIRQSTVGTYKEDKKPIDQLSDTEVEKLINDVIAFKSKDLDLTKKYIVEFKKVLSVKQVAKLLTAEDKFKHLLMKQAGQGPNGPPSPKPKPKPYAPK